MKDDDSSRDSTDSVGLENNNGVGRKSLIQQDISFVCIETEILKFLTYISSDFPMGFCCWAIQLRGSSFSEKVFEMISNASCFLNFSKEYYSGNNPRFVFLKNTVLKNLQVLVEFINSDIQVQAKKILKINLRTNLSNFSWSFFWIHQWSAFSDMTKLL